MALGLALTAEPTLSFLLSSVHGASPLATARKPAAVHPPMTPPVASRIDMTGLSARKLGGNLKNQYRLLQEEALPKAN